MSEATRAVALSEAVKTVGSVGVDAVIAAATKFDAFLNSAAPVAAPAPAGKPAATPAATKPATKPAATKPTKPTKPAKTEEQLAAEALAAAEAEAAGEGGGEATEGGEEATQDDVAAVVDGLLKAGKRADAVTLLKKYGATSVSKVKASDYAAFIAEGRELLPEADLTA